MSKTVLITGGSRGIGAAAAMLFAQEGYQVAVNYCTNRLRAVEVATRIRSLGQDAEVFCADVSDRIQVGAMVNAVEQRFGSIDVLVNNAGIAQQKLFNDISHAEWERMLAVNLTGMFHTCQCVLPQMIRRHSGKIINISSVWGITGASCEVHYSASKAAVIGLTKALAKEVGPSHITVNCVAPGVISTEMNAALDQETLSALQEETPLERIGSPEDAAHAIVFLASEKADFITGQVISPNGGFVI